MGKMNSTHKKIFFGLLAIAVLSLVVLAFQNNKDKEISKEDVAAEFLKTYYTVDNTDIAEHLDNSMLNGDDMSEAMEEFEVMIKQKYGKYLTEKGFSNAMANRYLPGYEMDINNSKLKGIEVVDITFPKTDTYDSGAQYFKYDVTVKTINDDGSQKEFKIEGELVMIKDNEGWKVDNFIPGYVDIGKESFSNGTKAEIKSNQNEFMLIHVSDEGDVYIETSQISSDEKEKINSAIFDYMVRSAAWDAIPIEEMGEYYLIIQPKSSTTEEEEKYYVFEYEGKHVMQWERAKRWTYITDASFNNIKEIINSREK